MSLLLTVFLIFVLACVVGSVLKANSQDYPPPCIGEMPVEHVQERAEYGCYQCPFESECHEKTIEARNVDETPVRRPDQRYSGGSDSAPRYRDNRLREGDRERDVHH